MELTGDTGTLIDISLAEEKKEKQKDGGSSEDDPFDFDFLKLLGKNRHQHQRNYCLDRTTDVAPMEGPFKELKDHVSADCIVTFDDEGYGGILGKEPCESVLREALQLVDYITQLPTILPGDEDSIFDISEEGLLVASSLVTVSPFKFRPTITLSLASSGSDETPIVQPTSGVRPKKITNVKGSPEKYCSLVIPPSTLAPQMTSLRRSRLLSPINPPEMEIDVAGHIEIQNEQSIYPKRDDAVASLPEQSFREIALSRVKGLRRSYDLKDPQLQDDAMPMMDVHANFSIPSASATKQSSSTQGASINVGHKKVANVNLKIAKPSYGKGPMKATLGVDQMMKGRGCKEATLGGINDGLKADNHTLTKRHIPVKPVKSLPSPCQPKIITSKTLNAPAGDKRASPQSEGGAADRTLDLTASLFTPLARSTPAAYTGTDRKRSQLPITPGRSTAKPQRSKTPVKLALNRSAVLLPASSSDNILLASSNANNRANKLVPALKRTGSLCLSSDDQQSTAIAKPSLRKMSTGINQENIPPL